MSAEKPWEGVTIEQAQPKEFNEREFLKRLTQVWERWAEEARNDEDENNVRKLVIWLANTMDEGYADSDRADELCYLTVQIGIGKLRKYYLPARVEYGQIRKESELADFFDVEGAVRPDQFYKIIGTPEFAVAEGEWDHNFGSRNFQLKKKGKIKVVGKNPILKHRLITEKLRMREDLIAAAKEGYAKEKEATDSLGLIEKDGDTAERDHYLDQQKNSRQRQVDASYDIAEIESEPEVMNALHDRAKEEDETFNTRKKEEIDRLTKVLERERRNLEEIATRVDEAAKDVTIFFKNDNGWNLNLKDFQLGIQEQPQGATAETLIEILRSRQQETGERLQAVSSEIHRLKNKLFKLGLAKLKEQHAILEAEQHKIEKQIRGLQLAKEKVVVELNKILSHFQVELENYKRQHRKVVEKVEEIKRRGINSVDFPDLTDKFPYAKILTKEGGSPSIGIDHYKLFDVCGYDRKSALQNRKVTDREIEERLKMAMET